MRRAILLAAVLALLGAGSAQAGYGLGGANGLTLERDTAVKEIRLYGEAHEFPTRIQSCKRQSPTHIRCAVSGGVVYTYEEEGSDGKRYIASEEVVAWVSMVGDVWLRPAPASGGGVVRVRLV